MVNTFITKLASFLESVILSVEPLLIAGDFNIHVDDANDPDTAVFLDLLESMNLFRATKSLLSQPRSFTVLPNSDAASLANEVGSLLTKSQECTLP